MDTREMIPTRRAALLLYGLPTEARQKIIARMNIAEVSQLQPLMDELAAMRVSRSVGQQAQHLAIAHSKSPTSGLQEQLEQLNAEEVAECLEHCAPATVAQLLRAGTTSWQKHALGHMQSTRRAEVTMYMSNSPSFAPAALQTLFELLGAHVARASLQRHKVNESHTVHPKLTGWAAARTEIKVEFERLLGWIR